MRYASLVAGPLSSANFAGLDVCLGRWRASSRKRSRCPLSPPPPSFVLNPEFRGLLSQRRFTRVLGLGLLSHRCNRLGEWFPLSFGFPVSTGDDVGLEESCAEIMDSRWGSGCLRQVIELRDQLSARHPAMTWRPNPTGIADKMFERV